MEMLQLTTDEYRGLEALIVFFCYGSFLLLKIVVKCHLFNFVALASSTTNEQMNQWIIP